ncbi:MAG: hypothetical protein L6Q54_11715 [Leptospiraceae bacterium]|nr:hypothetical protein [Leptospiraceae bacterium]
MDIGNVITILGILVAAVSMFYGLKNQVEKITIVVDNNTKEISSMRKLVESIAKHNENEHLVLRKNFEEIDSSLKHHGQRIYEIEKKIGMRT